MYFDSIILNPGDLAQIKPNFNRYSYYSKYYEGHFHSPTIEVSYDEVLFLLSRIKVETSFHPNRFKVLSITRKLTCYVPVEHLMKLHG